MSRAKLQDNSAAVSLFPFLAVLLCTMGALLVVLVAVSRSAREAALRKAAENHTADVEVAKDEPEVRREMEKIDSYVAKLKQLRGEAEHRLREDQLRLGHLESHIRRIHDELAKLQIAALELKALEAEHYDDRAQAERELARLQRLIEQANEAVETLKEEAKSGKRAYALVPYEGPNGTLRRPIYIECVKGELILQPEGVRITLDDLRPPLGPGNPLAAALRAARGHYTQLHPDEGRGRDAEPYPLLVVRPAGLLMYDRARRAIENSDFDFGFELVEQDWVLKYPAPDPQLAAVEQQAIEHARTRQQALAAAAPRAYRHSTFDSTRHLELDDEAGDGFGLLPYSGDGINDGTGSGGDGIGGEGSTGAPLEQSTTIGATQRTGAASATDSSPAGGGAEVGASAPAGANDLPANQVGAPRPSATASTAGANAAGGVSPPEPDHETSGAGGDSMMRSQSAVRGGASTVAQPEGAADALRNADVSTNRGQDWALERKKPNAVPIRRTIQIIVRSDHVAILPDDTPTSAATTGGKRIPLEDDTVQSLDKFIAAVREQIDGWGLAGDGLYWRPVLMLSVAADGQRRADDLSRLLKNSGFELRTPNVAAKNPEGDNRATR